MSAGHWEYRAVFTSEEGVDYELCGPDLNSAKMLAGETVGAETARVERRWVEPTTEWEPMPEETAS